MILYAIRFARPYWEAIAPMRVAPNKNQVVPLANLLKATSGRATPSAQNRKHPINPAMA